MEPALKTILKDDMSAIKKEVESGISELWEVAGCGYTVTRIEPDEMGKPFELVFVAGIGKNAKAVINHFRNLAKPMGIKKMRIHSVRKGMGRYLKPLGFGDVETVYKAVV